MADEEGEERDTYSYVTRPDVSVFSVLSCIQDLTRGNAPIKRGRQVVVTISWRVHMSS